MRNDYLLFDGEHGKTWVRASDIKGIAEYNGGSYNPCNGGSLLYVPGTTIGVTASPEQVRKMIARAQGASADE